MAVPFRQRIARGEIHESFGLSRRFAQPPPLFQNRTLHQTIGPADDGQRAGYGLAKNHAPEKFDRREKNPARARWRGREAGTWNVGPGWTAERARGGCSQGRRGRLRAFAVRMVRVGGVHAMASWGTRFSANSALKTTELPMVEAGWQG